jgi:hypothetical protein
MKFNDELTLFLKARYPIIYINTIEEDRDRICNSKKYKNEFKSEVFIVGIL